MKYLAKFEDDTGAILVTFPDIPEAITGGANEAEALQNAQEALDLALLNHALVGENFPVAGFNPTGGGTYRMINVSAHTQAKLAFINAFYQAGPTRVALAAKLGKSEVQVRRMLDPHHATKLPALEAGLLALGKRLVIEVEAA